MRQPYIPPPATCRHGRPTSVCAVCCLEAEAKYREWKTPQLLEVPAEWAAEAAKVPFRLKSEPPEGMTP